MVALINVAQVHDELPIHTTLVDVKCSNGVLTAAVNDVPPQQHATITVNDVPTQPPATSANDVPRQHALVTHDRQPTNDDPLQVLNGETYDEHPHAHNYGSRISNPVFYLLSLKEAL